MANKEREHLITMVEIYHKTGYLTYTVELQDYKSATRIMLPVETVVLSS